MTEKLNNKIFYEFRKKNYKLKKNAIKAYVNNNVSTEPIWSCTYAINDYDELSIHYIHPIYPIFLLK